MKHKYVWLVGRSRGNYARVFFCCWSTSWSTFPDSNTKNRIALIRSLCPLIRVVRAIAPSWMWWANRLKSIISPANHPRVGPNLFFPSYETCYTGGEGSSNQSGGSWREVWNGPICTANSREKHGKKTPAPTMLRFNKWCKAWPGKKTPTVAVSRSFEPCYCVWCWYLRTSRESCRCNESSSSTVGTNRWRCSRH